MSSNFTSFVFDGAALPIGIYNGGSQAMFDQYVSQVNLVGRIETVEFSECGVVDDGKLEGTYAP